jgi:Flp pilus assembly protein protease CpaA
MPDPAPPVAPEIAAAQVALPPSLRLLKWLVIVLTLTMIGGVITVVGLIVTRMPRAFTAAPPSVPAGLTLPEGRTAAAVTFGTGWVAVVTTDAHILVFDENGVLLQEVPINLAPGP